MKAAAALARALPRRAVLAPPKSASRPVPAPVVSLSAIPASLVIHAKRAKCAVEEKVRVAVRPGLAIGTSNDRYEREADRIADLITNDGVASAASRLGGSTTVRRPSATSAVASADRVAGSAKEAVSAVAIGGRPLSAGERAYFEPRFGQDLSTVRVHDGPRAAAAARAIGAKAYTYGRNIAFGRGHLALHARAGRHLLAHELAHTFQQDAGAPIRREPEDECETVFRRAITFDHLIRLIRAAESQLIACGYTDVGDRIKIIRGIFYGTRWSNDFAVEGSSVRNVAFQIYTGSVTTPPDPRPCMRCGMFEAIASSQDIVDRGRRVDVGHLIIGMDARRSSIARNRPIPTQGGTGLEIVTWLGDLGGGAAMTAYRRVRHPSRRARLNFRGTDFGGPINLEGDVAGFLVGRPSSPVSGPPPLQTGTTIADSLRHYFEPIGGTSGGEWQSRCTNALLAFGGTFDASGRLTNRSGLETSMRDKIHDFGCWYLINRLRQTGRLSLPDLRTAAEHLRGAAQETASIFIDALLHCHRHTGSALRVRTDPPPTPKASSAHGFCDTAISAMEAAEAAETRLRQIGEPAEGVYDDVRRRISNIDLNFFD